MNATAELPHIKLQRVLLATDFSDAAARPLPYVRALAHQFGSKVYVAHVMDELTHARLTGDARTIEAGREKARLKIGDWLALNGIEVTDSERITLTGDMNEELAATVQELKIDLIVLGSRACAGLERLLVGSRAEEIFRAAHCPVLTIGPEVAPERTAAVRFDRILYPTDLSIHSRTAVPYLVSLAQEYQSQITLLHLLHPDIQSPSERQRLREQVDGALRSFLPKEAQRFIGKTIVEFARPGEAIAEFATAEKGDLIALGIRGGGEFDRATTHLPWAIAHQVIASAPCPVLTIRAQS